MERGIALVTGAGTGIGSAICEALNAEGFEVALHCNRSKEAAEQLASKLNRAFVVQADISTLAGVESLASSMSSRGAALSVLVNNAGIVRDNFIFGASIEDFEEVINTNLRSAWYLTKKLIKSMMRRKAGRIINISSVVAHTGNAGQMLYGMSKAAIENFTKSAALEFAAYGILVNSIAPGFIDTEMTKNLPEESRQSILGKIPLGRMGTPQEIAEVVSFLATRASFCTGATFHVNGGMYVG